MNELPESELFKLDEEQYAQQNRRKFMIIHRERAKTEYDKKISMASIMATACILEGVIAIYFDKKDSNNVIEHELQMIYSIELLEKYFEDVKVLSNLFNMSAKKIIGRYLESNGDYEDVQRQFENMNLSFKSSSSLEVEI